MVLQKSASIGVVELPDVALFHSDGRNLTYFRRGNPLISKPILLANLQAGGFDAQLVDLRADNCKVEYGEVAWGKSTLTKVYVGTKIDELDPLAYDVWGITANHPQHREVACMLIKHLASGGRPIVVGGSDSLAEPQPYLLAGANAIVLDKSGAANWPIIDYVLGRTPREELHNVILPDSAQSPKRIRSSKHIRPMSPEDWPIPSIDTFKQCFGTSYWNADFPAELSPIGSIFADQGCDRKCDFCLTPTYGLGYRAMSPERALQWFALQKKAGAGSVSILSDQFLGRLLWAEKREEVLEIMKGVREMELPIHWPNGLELRKVTLGRGFKNTDTTPDEELIEALWGWDGKVGCYHAYIPGERPVFGPDAYAKLLPWEEHRAILRSVVRSGVQAITYGIIIGMPEDNNENLVRLEAALSELCQELSEINPSLRFEVAPYALSPIPGTPQWENVRQSGLMRFEEPSIFGGLWTPCADTHYLSYEEISDWQMRLIQISSTLDKKLISLNMAPDI